MKVDLLPIKAEVVAVDQDAPAEQVAETLMHLETVERAVKDVRRTFDDAFRSWLEQHGSLTVGEIRYYVGEKRETKVVDKAAAFDALVQATGGDAARLAEVLTASPFKVAAAREVLGDLFDQHFQTIVEIDTKEGKPSRRHPWPATRTPRTWCAAPSSAKWPASVAPRSARNPASSCPETFFSGPLDTCVSLYDNLLQKKTGRPELTLQGGPDNHREVAQ